MNEPVAWGMFVDGDFWDAIHNDEHNRVEGEYTVPLYTYPAKPSICVGYWDNKTGAFHKNLTELQQKRVADGFLQAVYTEGMLPTKTEDEGKVCARCGAIAYDPVITQTAKTLTDEEIEYLLRESIWALGLNSDCLEQENWDDAITVFRSILRKAQEK